MKINPIGLLKAALTLFATLAPVRGAAQWENIAPFPPVYGYAVTYGNGKFVTIPGFGYSPDNGVNWYQGSGAAALENPPYLPYSTYTKLIFGGTRFVALANTGQTSTSTDGVHWTSSRMLPDPGVGGPWDIAFGAGRFVGASFSAGFATSTDGEHWQKIDVISTDKPYVITYGNGKFLVGMGTASNGSDLFTSFAESTDGLHWTTRPAPTFYTSADCQTNGCPQVIQVFGLTFSSGKFVIVAYSQLGTTRLSSTDGIDWSPGEKISFPSSGLGRPAPNPIHDVNGTVQQDNIEFANGVYVTVGPKILRGASLTELQPVPLGYDVLSVASSIAAHGETIIAVGQARYPDQVSLPTLFTSTNGARTFEFRTNFTSRPIRKLAYANGKFFGAGDKGLIAESTSGIEWHELPSPVNWNLADFAVGNGRWVIVSGAGDDGVFTEGGALYSDDGVHFSKAAGTNIFFHVAFGGGRFVAAGPFYNAFFTSTNGADWMPAQSPASGFTGPIAYGNGRFVAGSNISLDGLTWQSGSRECYQIAFFKGRFYMAASTPPSSPSPYETSMFSSEDGVTWDANNVQAGLASPQVSDGTLWLLATPSSNWGAPGIWRQLAPSIQLESEAISSGKIRVRVDVPEPGRYRIQTSSAIEGPWQPGNLLDIGFRSGWDELTYASASRFFKVVRE